MMTEIQTAVQTALLANDYFEDIPVLVEDIADIDNEIARALGPLTEGDTGKSGVVAVVMTASGDVAKPNLPGPDFENIKIFVNIIETPLINRTDDGTNKRASAIAEQVARVLHHHTPTGGRLIYADMPTIRMIEPPEEGQTAWQAAFRTSGSAAPAE